MSTSILKLYDGAEAWGQIFMKNMKMLFAVSIGVILAVTSVSLSFLAYKQIKLLTEEQYHTALVIEVAENLMLNLVDAETGQRGFLLTGDEIFLENYVAVHDIISGQLYELRRITTVREAQKQLDVIEPLIIAKMTLLQEVIIMRRNNNIIDVKKTMRDGKGRQLMDSIRSEMHSYIMIEKDVLVLHEKDFQSNIRYVFVLIAVTSMLFLLFAFSFAYMIYRESQQRLTNLIYIKTKLLLDEQEELNKKLQLLNLSLQVSEDKLTVTLNSIGDAVLSTDVDGLVTFMNPVAEKLTLWGETEAVGRHVNDIFRIIDEDTREPSVNLVMNTLKQGLVQSLTGHYLIITREESEIPISDSCAPIFNRSGKVIGAVLVFRDVTMNRSIEIGLVKAHDDLYDMTTELKRTALVKTEFLSNISHELRTPLNSIIGFSEMLYDEIFGKINEKQKIYVDNVITSGKHLLSLVNQLLDTAKIDAGKMNLVLSLIPMKNLLFEITRLFSDTVDKKKIIMTLNIAEDLSDIEADDLKIKEIIYNLLNNAVKFTPQGGSIGLTAMNSESEIEIIIWDKGVGIDSENIDKIFEGFFRVDTPNSWVTEGTGLGLPLSKKLVELHGGKLSVVSDGLNKGTQVHFSLPLIFAGSRIVNSFSNITKNENLKEVADER